MGLPDASSQSTCPGQGALGILQRAGTRRSLRMPDLQNQLPMWPNDLRALPNALTSSTLFGVGDQQTKRELLERKTITALKGIEITYSGRELRQDDQDVFLKILHISLGWAGLGTRREGLQTPGRGNQPAAVVVPGHHG